MKALSLIATVTALLIRPPQIPAAESSQERTTELLARIPCLEFIVDPSRPRRVLMSCDEYVLSHFTAADSLNLLDIVRDPAKKQLWDNAFYAIGMLALGGKTQITPGDLIAAVEAVE